jgi:hypothetical protein
MDGRFVVRREFTCCDSCEEILNAGGIRMVVEGNPDQTVDLCPSCLAEVLPEYARMSRTDLLTVTISPEDFQLLMAEAEDTEDDTPADDEPR